MIINSANKFIENVSWWISFFNVVFWILALIPVGIFMLLVVANGPIRRADETFFLFISFVVYIAVAFFVHRLTLLGFQFMKAIVTTALECQKELNQIRNELKKPASEEEELQAPTKPSPFNFSN